MMMTCAIIRRNDAAIRHRKVRQHSHPNFHPPPNIAQNEEEDRYETTSKQGNEKNAESDFMILIQKRT